MPDDWRTTNRRRCTVQVVHVNASTRALKRDAACVTVVTTVRFHTKLTVIRMTFTSVSGADSSATVARHRVLGRRLLPMRSFARKGQLVQVIEAAAHVCAGFVRIAQVVDTGVDMLLQLLGSLKILGEQSKADLENSATKRACRVGEVVVKITSLLVHKPLHASRALAVALMQMRQEIRLGVEVPPTVVLRMRKARTRADQAWPIVQCAVMLMHIAL